MNVILVSAFATGLFGLVAMLPFTVYSAIGFGGGFFGTWLFRIVLGWFGGPAVLAAWVLTFATSGMACLLGVAAMTCLRERRETGLNPAD